jgi:hypothetical protein
MEGGEIKGTSSVTNGCAYFWCSLFSSFCTMHVSIVPPQWTFAIPRLLPFILFYFTSFSVLNSEAAGLRRAPLRLIQPSNKFTPTLLKRYLGGG